MGQPNGVDTAPTDEAVFVPEDAPQEVLDLSGTKHTIPPKLPLGREVRLFRALNKILQALRKTGFFGKETPADRTQMEFGIELLGAILEDSPEALGEAAGAVLGKTKDWAETNLDLEVTIGIVLPFLRKRLTALTAAIVAQSQGLTGGEEPPTPTGSPVS